MKNLEQKMATKRLIMAVNLQKSLRDQAVSIKQVMKMVRSVPMTERKWRM